MLERRLIAFLGIAFFCGSLIAADAQPRRVVVIAGKKSHGPEGNGIHDYNWSARLIKVMLDNSNVRDRVTVQIHTDGWPTDTSSLESADTIMIISDGRDGELFEEALHLATPERVELIGRQVRRGCGLVTFHFSTFAPDRLAEQVFDWVGGYFDWETDGKRQWYSAIQVADTLVDLARPEHPSSRGVRPFSLREEFYFNLRFQPADPALVPILRVPALPGRDEEGRIVAWARERPGGGRGFGTTCGHFFDNWQNDSFRKLMLNGIVWSAGVEVPAEGVTSRYYAREELAAALKGIDGTERASVDDRPIKALLFAGNDAHRWHNWEKTTPAIKDLLEKDGRVRVDVTQEIEDLARRPLGEYQAVILNYANWKDPRGLSDDAKRAFELYLKRGGGLLVIHFANGAFHYSLPEAAASDWPEYRKIVRRVWDHQGKGESQSGHDAFGPFRVRIAEQSHPITAGLADFNVTDELYFRQAGDEPIEPLIVAHSKVTGRDEPLAFAYRYGDGRVFQTLLGHSERTYDSFAAREMLRRALAWVSDRPIRPAPEPAEESDAPLLPAKGEKLIAGRFDKGLDARVAVATSRPATLWDSRPLTIDAWVRLASKSSYNILLAHGAKSAADHFELFTNAGNGLFTIYVPGCQPDHVRSSIDLVDGKWHHVSAILEENRIRLFADGKVVGDEAVTMKMGSGEALALALGGLVEGGFGCDGWIDDVRICKGTLEIDAAPTEPATADSSTRGLWNFNAATSDEVPAAGGDLGPLTYRPAEAPVATQRVKVDEHYSEAALGFRWAEPDSADGRWNDTEIGPFLASNVFLPGLDPVARGLSVRVGDDGREAVLYDTERMNWRAAWTGGYLHFDPTRHGLIKAPAPAGKIVAMTQPAPPRASLQYRALLRHGQKVTLEYSIDGITVWEHPWAEVQEGTTVFTRSFRVAPAVKGIEIPLGTMAGGTNLHWNVQGGGELKESDGASVLVIGAGETPRQVTLWLAEETDRKVDPPAPLTAEAFQRLLAPGERISKAEVTTRTEVGRGEGPYVVDVLPLPFDNPYRSLCFASGLDFLPSGDLAVSMVHGDIWVVSGVHDAHGSLRWKRFATGLFQPLGLKVRDGSIYVLGRDQITRLVDRNADGEADRHEVFFNGYETSTAGHDFVSSLETDARGNFYLAHATQGVVRVAADGSHADVMAMGFRNPNGLGVGPDGQVTITPQEGEWTPSSAIVEITPGRYYGYPGKRPPEEFPEQVDPPLCWIPRLVDNSSGGQTWVTGDRWGPLAGQMLHFSYGQCRMFLGLREAFDGVVQGGVVPFPLEFRSGIMRGEFSPFDGQLYVAGLRGWVTAAVDDGCLCRVRYTGEPADLPMAVRTMKNGLTITFTDPLAPTEAQDPDSYTLQAWNYRRSSRYGSPDLSVRDPNRVGRDDVDVVSATLLDPRTVFLEIPDLTPCNQLSIACRLRSESGRPIEQAMYYTIHRTREESIPESRLVRRARKGDLPSEVEARLRPGLLWQVEADRQVDELTLRQMAWNLAEGESISPFLTSVSWSGNGTGYLRVVTPGDHEFRLEGDSAAELSINGSVIAATSASSGSVRLHRGYNSVALKASPAGRRLRVYWSSRLFAEEPVPSAVLFHDPGRSAASEFSLRDRGRILWEQRRCDRCHQFKEGVAASSPPGPSLEGMGRRLQPEWIARWLLDPHALRPGATMGQFFHSQDAGDRQAVADVVAFLSVSADGDPSSAPGPSIAGDAEVGAELYEELGCLACHRQETSTEGDPWNRVPLAEVGSKFRPGELARFLGDPTTHYSTTRMPHFHLAESESAALSAYLSGRKATDGSIVLPPGDRERGAKIYRERGCAHCHAPEAPGTARLALNVSESDRGCLAAERTADTDAPDHHLDASERGALANYLQSGSIGLASSAPLTKTRDLVEFLNCRACHSRDGSPSPRIEIVQEESARGLPPELLPDLSWAGEKIEPTWTAKLLRGEAPRARPWLKGRMPAWPAYADALAHGLAAEHGVDDRASPALEVDPALAKMGRELVGLKTGLDCRQCHGIGAEMPLGDDKTQLALGVNFALVRDRVRRDFYRLWMLDPPRFDIATRMPKVSLDGKTTRITQVADGDARRQFDAIWHFIHSLPK